MTIPATGSGTATPVVATDDVGPGVHYQKVKLDLGGDGVTDTLVTDVTGKVPTTAQGNVAHDAVDAGNPAKVGGKAATGTPTAVADADRVNAWFDQFGRLVTRPASVVSTGNSSTAILGISGVFTGTGEETKDYATITILVKSDVASATDGLSLQYSSDNTNWDDNDVYTIAANTGKFFTVTPEGQYFRIVYTNGGTAQVFFRLQTIYHYHRTKPSSHRFNDTDAIEEENDAELVIAIAQGNIASDSPDLGRPLKIGGKASSGVPGAVASADRVNAYFDVNGRQAVFTDVALPAGDNNIGNVDVVTLPALVAGAANIGDVDIASPLGPGTEAAAVRVTVATDSTGVISVDDNGGSLTVDNATLSVTGGGVEATAMRVTLASDSTGLVSVDDNGGTLTVDAPVGTPVAVRQSDGAAFIEPRGGNVAHDAVDSGNPVKIGGKAEASRPTTVADADRVDAWIDTLGRQIIQVGSAQDNRVANEYTASQTDAVQIAAPGVNLRIVIYDIVMSTGTAGTALLESGTTVREFGRISLAVNGGWSFNSAKGYALPVNTQLALTTTTGAGPFAITVNYAIVQDLAVAGVA